MIFHIYKRLFLCALAAIIVVAGVFVLPQKGLSADPVQNVSAGAQLQSLFDNLQIAGNAYNGGGGKAALDAVLGSGCAALSGSQTLNDYFSDELHFAKKGNMFGDLIAAQGQQGINAAMNGACSALTGQGSSMSGADMLSQSGSQIFQAVVAAGKRMANGSGLPFLKRLEVETSLERRQVVSTVTSIQPLWVDHSKTNHVFTQLSWRRIEGHDTANTGLVWRHLNDAKTMMWGANAFFDHGFERNHNRASVGLDFRTSQLGIAANRYVGLSDWRSVDLYIEERAASGWDLEVNGQVPQLPSWTASVKGYKWDGQDHIGDEMTAIARRSTTGLVGSLEYAPIAALAIRGGVRSETTAAPSVEMALRFNLKLDQPIDWQIKPRTRLASVEERVYDKVSRENTIRVEQRRKASAVLNVIETVGANSINGQPGVLSLSVGLSVLMPSTLTVANSVGAYARLVFSDGAILTAGQDTEVRIEADKITLIHGVAQYTSGGVTRVVNVPGGTIQLLGTDIDVVSDGVNSSVRVRDGAVTIAGALAGTLTLNAGQLAQAVSGVVSSITPNTVPADAHTDKVSVNIDRPANSITGTKVAPYPADAPRLISSGTLPGQAVLIGLKFNTVVNVGGGTPRLVFTINGNSRNAALSSGSGTNDLTFTYTLQVADAGANSLTVTSLDANGATISDGSNDAITSVADTTLTLSGMVVNPTPVPSGYGVAFTTTPINNINKAAAALSFTSAEVGSTYNYAISSSGGGTNVTGTGTIATATQAVTGIDVSALGDGTLTASLTLTNGGGAGIAATATTTKSTAASITVAETTGSNTADSQPTTVSLSPGLQLSAPTNLVVANTAGAIARLTFNDGAVLRAGQDTQLTIEDSKVTLVKGIAQYVSGSVSRTITVPGGTIDLLGTDLDMISDGTTTTIRDREGSIKVTGTSSGSPTLAAGDLARIVGGVVTLITPNTVAADTHTDAVNMKIERIGTAITGTKIAPYTIAAPRFTSSATVPGQDILIGLQFNTTVTSSSGPPQLLLTIGANSRVAALNSGSGSNDLIFRYTLQASDTGASSVIVKGLDANGATIKDGNNLVAVTSVADTTLNLSGPVTDVTPPAGYTIAFTTSPIDSVNASAAALSFTSAEVGSTYNYSITSSGGGTAVTGSGTAASASQAITGVNVSGLGDGTLRVSATLTDTAGNLGGAVTATVTKAATPTLSMNFVGGTYSLNGTGYASLGTFLTAAGGTFTRASVGTYYDVAGTMQTATSGTPRLDYDPVTHVAKGILIEEQRTNVIKYSNSFRTVPWDFGTCNGTGFVDSGTTTIAPDGNSVPVYNFGTTDCIFQDTTVVTGQPVTHSVWIKANKTATIGFRTPGTTGTTSTPFSIGTTWQRISLTATSNGTTSRLLVDNRATNGYGTTGLQISLFGGQVELGSFPSSYIPTAASTVTRAADDLRVPAGVWFSSSAGTLLAAGRLSYLGAATSPGLATLTDGNATGNNDIALFVADGSGDTKSAVIYNAASAVFAYNGAAYTANAATKLGITYQLNDAIAAVDGTLSPADTSVTLPTIVRLNVGRTRGEGSPLNGWVSSITYYPARVANSSLQTLTGP